MPTTVGGIRIDPQGLYCVVDIVGPSGVRPTVYSSTNGATAQTLPLAISATTEFHFVLRGVFSVSVRYRGQEIAGQNGNTVALEVGSGAVFNLAPSIDQFESQSAWSSRSQAAAPYLPVADRTNMMTRLATLSNGTDTGSNVRFKHTMLCTARNLRVRYANFYNSSGIETDGANNIVVRAAIESPAGTFLPVFFNGSRDVTIQPGASVLSDPVGLTLAKGATFSTRTFVTATGTWPLHAATTSLSEGSSSSNGETDKTTSGTISNSTTFSYAPYQILGIPKVPGSAVVGLIGDSIMGGSGDASATSSGQPIDPFAGHFPRALNQNYQFVRITAASDSADTSHWRSITAIMRRFPLLETCTHLIVSLGVNQMSTCDTDVPIVWANLAQLGIPIYACTVTPKTTSSDSWATTSGQTVTADESHRVALNALIRTTPSPLAGYFEVADAVETARDSGKWQSVGSGLSAVITSDGAHPTAAGYAQIAASSGMAASVFKAAFGGGSV